LAISSTQQQSAGVSLRRTKAEDMESVVALDAAIVGHPRYLYFQRRLKAALDQTERHVQFSAEQDGRFVGFIKARKLLGEFGRAESALLLESISVAPAEQGQGIGSALLARLETEAQRLGVPEIRTTTSWRDHAIMRFFDSEGLELSYPARERSSSNFNVNGVATRAEAVSERIRTPPW
jgi:GNAT superfamily N-acetyltransferase